MTASVTSTCDDVSSRAGVPRRLVLPALLALLACTMLLALGIGALHVPAPRIVAILLERVGVGLDVPFAPTERSVVLAVRLPRVFLGIAVGASLGVSGAAMQGCFRNPLVEPGLLGLSGGCALGAAVTIVFGTRLFGGLPPSLAPYILSVASFTTGIGTILLIQKLARREGRTSVALLLLVGVAINALAEALTGLLSYAATDSQLRAITSWRLGSLGGATWHSVIAVTPFVLPMLVLPRAARSLNAILLGENEAGHLGFDVEKVKRMVLVLVSLMVGASVAVSGVLAFVGLLVPHILRAIVGSDHRLLIPGSALLGASLLLFADTLARTLASPAELPLGVITAMLGAPFLLVLLLRERRSFA